MTEQDTPKKAFFTVRQTTERNPSFTEGALRAIIFHADTNGFARCIRRIGRKILISESDFLDWIETQPVKLQ